MLQQLHVRGRREEKAAGGKGWFPTLRSLGIITAAATAKSLLSSKVFEQKVSLYKV